MKDPLFKSDRLKETIYHQMSHVSHYSQMGNTWYGNLVTKELNETQNYPGSDPLNPYGHSTSADAPMIALAEAWAYHMGHFLADQRYGVNAYCEHEGNQKYKYCPDLFNHPNIDVLEYYVPTYTTDPFYWIPKGLMEDLIDNGEPTFNTFVNDQVSGYTISQIFRALQSDVSSVPQYKARLLQQNPSNPTNTYVNALFPMLAQE